MLSVIEQEEHPDPVQPATAKPLRLSVRMLQVHQLCDNLSGKIILPMVVFSPWAFGTTEPWTIRVMNGLGYALGALLFIKLGIRWWSGLKPPRWGDCGDDEGKTRHGAARFRRFFVRGLALASFLIPAYCLVSAVNARGVFHAEDSTFEYLDRIAWLPNSYDRGGTWLAFYNCLALAMGFWAVRDWLLGKSPDELRLARMQTPEQTRGSRPLLPERFRHLLWVLSINGGLLAVEGIGQRLVGESKLLFVMPTHMNRDAAAQFGPYAYRSNAAQYFNLLWPVTLGFWWTFHKASRNGAMGQRGFKLEGRHLLLGSALLMAACPIISTTRAGACVAVIQLALAALILWSAQRKDDYDAKGMILIGLGMVLGFGALLGWERLAPRLSAESMRDGFEGRNETYEHARQMVVDYPLFGTGPGSFARVFGFYRTDPAEYWPAQLHNDWLETRITFGLLGIFIIASALCLVLTRWFVPGGIRSSQRLTLLLWVALAGCLAHARYDFPFQVYSIVFLFLLLCSMLFCLSNRGARSSLSAHGAGR